MMDNDVLLRKMFSYIILRISNIPGTKEKVPVQTPQTTSLVEI
jgi:hypothetical protein